MAKQRRPQLTLWAEKKQGKFISLLSFSQLVEALLFLTIIMHDFTPSLTDKVGLIMGFEILNAANSIKVY